MDAANDRAALEDIAGLLRRWIERQETRDARAEERIAEISARRETRSSAARTEVWDARMRELSESADQRLAGEKEFRARLLALIERQNALLAELLVR